MKLSLKKIPLVSFPLAGMLIAPPIFAYSSDPKQNQISAVTSSTDDSPAWRQSIEGALDKVENGLKELDQKSKTATGRAKEDLQKTMAELNARKVELRREFEEQKKSGSQKAKDYWTRLKAAADELDRGVDAAIKKLKAQ